MKEWSVYKHTFPDGKVYIGITSLSPEDRWNNGFGYESQRKFFKQIVAVGWDNIRHDIIETGLDEDVARKIERRLIKEAIEQGRGYCLNTLETGRTPKVKSSIGDLPFCEHDPITRGVKLGWYFDDAWLEHYYRFFKCYPHLTEVQNDAVYLYWYFNMVEPMVYRVPLAEDIITYQQLWEYLNNGVEGAFVKFASP